MDEPDLKPNVWKYLTISLGLAVIAGIGYLVLQRIDQSIFRAVLFIVVVATSSLASMFVYFLPTFIAVMRRHPQVWPIVVINFFTGWLYIGWVVALAWSVANVRRI